MSQRSQIYVRYDSNEKKELIANYYSWVFGCGMISRARGAIEFVSDELKHKCFGGVEDDVKLSRVLDTNFDLRDIQLSSDIIKEYEESANNETVCGFNEFAFFKQHNNDGKLLIDICGTVIKYAFLDRKASLDNIMDANSYMIWEYDADWKDSIDPNDAQTCEENIAYIIANATLMSSSEVEEFLWYDYGYCPFDALITFCTINVDGLEVVRNFNSVKDMKKDWQSDDCDLPSGDDEVIYARYNGDYLDAENFDDVVRLLGLDSII